MHTHIIRCSCCSIEGAFLGESAMDMEKKTDRSNCHSQFSMQATANPCLWWNSTKTRSRCSIGISNIDGFDLLGGITLEQARKLAEMLNEHVLDLVLITGGKSEESVTVRDYFHCELTDCCSVLIVGERVNVRRTYASCGCRHSLYASAPVHLLLLRN